MTFATSGTLGVDFTKKISGTTTDGVNAEFKLGTCVKGSDGTEWIYVQASGAITQYSCLAIDENFQAAAVTSALAGAGHKPGFAQVAFSDNDIGWVAIRGSNISVRAASACAADALLYVGTTGLSAGVVDDASASGRVTLQGVVLVTAAVTGTQAEEIIATNPIFLNV